jgi:hypothetical protein
VSELGWAPSHLALRHAPFRAEPLIHSLHLAVQLFPVPANRRARRELHVTAPCDALGDQTPREDREKRLQGRGDKGVSSVRSCQRRRTVGPRQGLTKPRRAAPHCLPAELANCREESERAAQVRGSWLVIHLDSDQALRACKRVDTRMRQVTSGPVAEQIPSRLAPWTAASAERGVLNRLC